MSVIGGVTVVVDKRMLGVNASTLCSAYNRKLYHWSNMESTQDLFRRLEMRGFRSPYEIEFPSDAVFSGTYIPQVALPSLLFWLDTDFYLQVCRLVSGITDLNPTKSVGEHLEALRSRIMALEERLAAI